MQHRRVIWGIGLIGLLVGCASTGALPSSVVTATPEAQASESTASPSPPSTPSVVPSEGAWRPGTPCDPATASFRGPNETWAQDRPLLGSDTVMLRKCSDMYLQQIGQAPVRFHMSLSDWHMGWLAPDGSSAIGMAPDGLIVRRRPPVSSEELIKATKGHGLEMSADGRFAAYLVTPESQPTSPSVLHLMQIDTGEVRPSGEVTRVLAWSPDGRKVLVMKTLPSGHTGGLAWASWDDPTVRFIGDGRPAAVGARDAFIWSGDSQHVVIIGQSPNVPASRAGMVVFKLDGTIVTSKGVTDSSGAPLIAYNPTDVQAGNTLIAGYNGLLDPSTGVVSPLPADAVPRWSTRFGELLRWRQGPDGPTLDTVKADL